MNAFVVDTHTLMWWLDGTLQKRSKKASEILRMAEAGDAIALLPAIVLLELLWSLRKKGIVEKYEEFLERLYSLPSWHIIPVDMDVAFEVFHIHEKGLEMHDSIIVATARLQKAPLLTKDPHMKAVERVETIW